MLLVAKIDRLSRDIRHAMTTVSDLAEQHEVAFRSVTESVIDTSNPMGRTFFAIFAGMAENERFVIRDRTAGGRVVKAGKGGFAGGKAPYGYEKDLQGGLRVVEDANNKVRPSKLDIGSMAANLCPNGDMEEVAGGVPAGWTLLNAVGAGSGVSAYMAAAYAGKTSLLLSKATATTSSAVAALGPRMDVTPAIAHGLTFFVAPMAGTTTSGFSVQARYYDKTDALLSVDTRLNNGPVSAGWTEVGLPVTPPTTCAYVRLGFVLSEASTAQYVAIDAVVFQPAFGSVALRDAAITAAKFYAPTRGQFFRALENSGAGRVATVAGRLQSRPGRGCLSGRLAARRPARPLRRAGLRHHRPGDGAGFLRAGRIRLRRPRHAELSDPPDIPDRCAVALCDGAGRTARHSSDP
ncbi:hypothetical protein FHU13_003277 [Methylobacterium sp. R2-1]|nr:hypothetical protein [Methylobacterium sp. R2-1]